MAELNEGNIDEFITYARSRGVPDEDILGVVQARLPQVFGIPAGQKPSLPEPQPREPLTYKERVLANTKDSVLNTLRALPAMAGAPIGQPPRKPGETPGEYRNRLIEGATPEGVMRDLKAPFDAVMRLVQNPKEAFAEDPAGTVALPLALLRGGTSPIAQAGARGAAAKALAPTTLKLRGIELPIPGGAMVGQGATGAALGKYLGGDLGAYIGGAVGAGAPLVKGGYEGILKYLEDLRTSPESKLVAERLQKSAEAQEANASGSLKSKQNMQFTPGKDAGAGKAYTRPSTPERVAEVPETPVPTTSFPGADAKLNPNIRVPKFTPGRGSAYGKPGAKVNIRTAKDVEDFLEDAAKTAEKNVSKATKAVPKDEAQNLTQLKEKLKKGPFEPTEKEVRLLKELQSLLEP